METTTEAKIHENHQLRQFFFDPPTIKALAEFVNQYENPCCLCTPMVAKALHEKGRAVRVLDIDERFRFLPGFMLYNLYRPAYLQEDFDLVLVDPPFHAVGLGQLFKAIRVLSHFNFEQEILMTHLRRRSWGIEATFDPFRMKPTELSPRYQTARDCNGEGRSRVIYYSNFDVEGQGL
jgi:hypothetical protein